jgi:hypothetical protein
MTEKSGKSINYTFSHVSLPGEVLCNSDRFYRIIHQDAIGAYLQDIWHNLAGNNQLAATIPPFDVSFNTLERNVSVLIIKTPPPSEASEAYYIGIALFTKKQLLWKRMLCVRYFTLEQGELTDKHHVCEYVFMHHELQRKMNNIISVVDHSSFMKEIGKIIKGENTVFVHDSYGERTGRVALYPSGKTIVMSFKRDDPTSILLSIVMSFANDLTYDERIIISNWAGMSEETWSMTHCHYFAIAALHHILSNKSSEFPSYVAEIPKVLTLDHLPCLPRPMTSVVNKMLVRFFRDLDFRNAIKREIHKESCE